MNVKAISRNVGYALLVSALFMLFSVLNSLANGSDSALAALSISFVITFTVGIFPFIFVRKTSAITLKDGYMIILLSWLLSFVFGMLPYALWGGPFTLANAWFESVSGFTTSGATILDDVEALPRSLLFWRSSTHFIGGLGVVVFLLLIIPNASPIRMRLTNMELSSLSKDSYNTRTNKTVYIFAYVYLALVLCAFFAYLLAGMPAFDAVNHAFSVCATGGFSTRNLSIAAFDSRPVELVTMVFMFLSSIHFGILYMTVVTRSLRAWKNPVLKFYVASLLLCAALLAVSFKANGVFGGWGESVWHALFAALSVGSTTGLASMDTCLWPEISFVLVMSCAVMCGCAGSTSGGLKVDRALVFLKSVVRRVGGILHPSAVSEIRLGRSVLRDEDVYPHILYIGLYFLLIFVSVVLCMALGLNSENAFAGSIVSVGNVGPAIGELGSFGSYSSIPSSVKFVFTMDMFLGRVEIYPVLAVLGMLFGRNNR